MSGERAAGEPAAVGSDAAPTTATPPTLAEARTSDEAPTASGRASLAGEVTTDTDGRPATEDARPGLAVRMAERVHERRIRHRQRSLPHRVAVVALGFVVTLLGMVLAAPGVPGPGFLVILVGVATLALEFAWAERLLNRLLSYAELAGQRAATVGPRGRLVIAALLATAVAAAVVAVVSFDVDVPYVS